MVCLLLLRGFFCFFGEGCLFFLRSLFADLAEPVVVVVSVFFLVGFGCCSDGFFCSGFMIVVRGDLSFVVFFFEFRF